MLLQNLNIGFAITGSFCTISEIISAVELIVGEGANVYPIVSTSVKNTDTRFGMSKDFIDKLRDITGKEPWSTIAEVEPIGPKGMLDILVVAPCTGNTIAKIANAITDTPVTMAVKAHLRNKKPVVICVSTNDGLSANGKNIGQLLNTKYIYFVPFFQDNAEKKPNSLISEVKLITPTIIEALKGNQVQPVLVQR